MKSIQPFLIRNGSFWQFFASQDVICYAKKIPWKLSYYVSCDGVMLVNGDVILST